MLCFKPHKVVKVHQIFFFLMRRTSRIYWKVKNGTPKPKSADPRWLWQVRSAIRAEPRSCRHAAEAERESRSYRFHRSPFRESAACPPTGDAARLKAMWIWLWLSDTWATYGATRRYGVIRSNKHDPWLTTWELCSWHPVNPSSRPKKKKRKKRRLWKLFLLFSRF